MKHQKSDSPITDDRISALVTKAARLAEAGRLEEALAAVVSTNVVSDKLRNARGVCLMRLGRFDDAVRVYRGFILHSGSTWMRPELPVIYRTNFCTALLLAGLTSGGKGALYEMHELDHPSVVRLRDAISRWERSLPWWTWLNWKMGVESDRRVTLDGSPGDFMEIPVVTPATAASRSASVTLNSQVVS